MLRLPQGRRWRRPSIAILNNVFFLAASAAVGDNVLPWSFETASNPTTHTCPQNQGTEAACEGPESSMAGAAMLQHGIGGRSDFAPHRGDINKAHAQVSEPDTMSKLGGKFGHQARLATQAPSMPLANGAAWRGPTTVVVAAADGPKIAPQLNEFKFRNLGHGESQAPLEKDVKLQEHRGSDMVKEKTHSGFVGLQKDARGAAQGNQNAKIDALQNGAAEGNQNGKIDSLRKGAAGGNSTAKNAWNFAEDEIPVAFVEPTSNQQPLIELLPDPELEQREDKPPSTDLSSLNESRTNGTDLKITMTIPLDSELMQRKASKKTSNESVNDAAN